jgi:hypothetical protein
MGNNPMPQHKGIPIAGLIPTSSARPIVSNQKHIGGLSNIGKTSASAHETGANHYPILCLAIAWDGSGGVGGQVGGSEEDVVSTPEKNKRFSGFDFYRRKLFSPSTSPRSPFACPLPSQSQLSNTSLADVRQKEPPDPTRGYHPLIDVYGMGHFSSR